ncbi:hypothetical protein J6590_019038 [Homalodisca vitripennis]|nr:hypothetical protein J6590_019038 [Homalodisca vitripennis]
MADLVTFLRPPYLHLRHVYPVADSPLAKSSSIPQAAEIFFSLFVLPYPGFDSTIKHRFMCQTVLSTHIVGCEGGSLGQAVKHDQHERRSELRKVNEAILGRYRQGRNGRRKSRITIPTMTATHVQNRSYRRLRVKWKVVKIGPEYHAAWARLC